MAHSLTDYVGEGKESGITQTSHMLAIGTAPSISPEYPGAWVKNQSHSRGAGQL